jgi:HD-GYP domain-containing protein (c-di-GMP phosphodiesterase class II)
MNDNRGTHFDPDVVDAFLAVHAQFREIAARFDDAGVEPEPARKRDLTRRYPRERNSYGSGVPPGA